MHPTPPLRHLQLIGAATDVGASVRGASMGPDALRVAGLAAALRALDCTVHDLGNLPGPPNPEQTRQDGYRHLHETLAWCQSVHDATWAALQAGQLPIVMGGDHSVAIGSISAVARHCRAQGRALRVLWLDAHADANTAATSPTGHLHGMPVACLCGMGPAALTELSGQSPALHPEQLAQLGIRSVDPQERHMLQQLHIQVLDMRSIDELGMRQAMAQVLHPLDEQTHLHVSFDVDFLDPTIAPGVATTVSGGPNYREAQLCMEMIADTGRLASLDVVELNPAYDTRNQTARLAVELIESLFGKSTLLRG